MFAIYHCLSQFFTGLRKAVAAESGPRWSYMPVGPRMTVPLIVRVWKYLAWLEPRVAPA